MDFGAGMIYSLLFFLLMILFGGIIGYYITKKPFGVILFSAIFGLIGMLFFSNIVNFFESIGYLVIVNG